MKPTAYEGNEKYIFVSYAHRDRDEVYKVLNEMERCGYRFWYDEGVAPGSEWPEDIADHLSRSVLLLAFISPNAVASSNVRREINYALSKEKPFLSIVLEPTEMSPGMEMQLSSCQSIIKYKYSSWESFMRKLYLCSELEVCRADGVTREEGDVGRFSASLTEAKSVSQTAPAAPGKTADPSDSVFDRLRDLILALLADLCGSSWKSADGVTREEGDSPVDFLADLFGSSWESADGVTREEGDSPVDPSGMVSDRWLFLILALLAMIWIGIGLAL